MNPFFKKATIKWGIIGCGAVTEVKSGPAFIMTTDFEVTMVMRRNLDKAKDYAKRHKVPNATSDAIGLINSPEVDAVYIATPPDTHKHYGLLVAAAGKPCCIEKPMAPSYTDSLEIYKAFKEKNLPLFISYYRRSLPRFLKVKEWLDKELIGAVRHIKWFKSKPPNSVDLSGAYNWRTDAKIAPGGYFDDLASHGLDLFIYFFGDVKEAKGIAVNQQGLYDAFDAVTASWIYENGITGVGSWNFGTHHREDKVEIYGTKGKISFSVLDEAPLVLEVEGAKEEVVITNPKHIQEYHVLNIKKHLLGEKLHPSTGESGLHTSWVMSEILKQN